MNDELMQLKITQPNHSFLLQSAVQNGLTVIVENAGEITNNALLSIVRRETMPAHGEGLLLKFNDNQIEFDKDFYCYICSQFSNPHFNPEV